MLACILVISAPVILAFLARAVMAAPHAALLLPAIGAVAFLASIASVLPG